jgi:hypothetical protein
MFSLCAEMPSAGLSIQVRGQEKFFQEKFGRILLAERTRGGP